jgi:hypothetical protein
VTCRCGHEDATHHHGHSCTAIVDEVKLKYCKCEEFRESKSEGENEMPKEKAARVKKPKSEGRKPTLAGLVDSPLVIFMTTGKKEYKGTVLSSGVIKIDEKEFTSPSSAASYILGKDDKGKPKQADGWKCWSFNKDGERVVLDTLRGAKSPLKAVAPKPKKVKAAPKKARTPRAAKKSKANGAEKHDVSDKDIPQNEATATA